MIAYTSNLVVCRAAYLTNRNTVVAQCFLDDLDIAAEMVRSGNACDWPKFSGGHYRIDNSTWLHP